MLKREEREKILQLWEQGYSKNQIARETGHSWATVDKIIKYAGSEQEDTGLERELELVELTFELEEMQKHLQADNPAVQLLRRKIECCLKNVRKLDDKVMSKIREEYEQVARLPPREEILALLKAYKEVKDFERRKNMSLEAAVEFIRQNRDLVFSVRELRREREELLHRIETLRKEFEKFESRREAFVAGMNLGYKAYVLGLPMPPPVGLHSRN